ncbi:hypothetical protein KVR01_000530 [Diaporthe batatas]|uniref:uncharacterized protein n=1 Tax=Diaporthe batatas TaxID=748121 RepID=UPI001D04C2D5|nr:uncharacterized protein KVR01_000530 [Diaporthe batatas]KAG8169785.1 hypothetical protein KVR01_000530 [Diaporthe batatas]
MALSYGVKYFMFSQVSLDRLAPIMADLPTDFRVCIVGAGIVGLACAISLRQKGFQVTVVEKDKAIETTGAGIELQPNAVRVLQDLGVYDHVLQRSVLTPALVLKEYTEGRVLHTQSVVKAAMSYGAPCLSVHRPHLRNTLHDKAVALGVKVMFGQNIQTHGLDLDHGRLTLGGSDGASGQQEIEDGPGTEPPQTLCADLFIGADGANSSLREVVTGHKTDWVPHGKVVIRILIDVGLIREHEDLRHLVERRDCVVWLGPESQAVTYCMGEIFNVAFTRPWSTDAKDAFYAPQKVDFEAFVEQLAAEGWDVRLRKLIGLARGTDILRWMFFEPQIDDEGTPWVNATGTCCLVGDAAHRTLPYLAQGAAIGLESAAVLAGLLGKVRSKQDVPKVLGLYERLRKERSGHAIRASLRNGRVWQVPDGPLKEERDRQLLNETPTAGFPNILADPFFQSWLWGYDTSKVVDEAWSMFVNGQSHY